jgi:hypothetical protein
MNKQTKKTKPRFVPNITFKSVLSGYRSTEKRNEHFESLSNEGKRLEIAWDMLQLVMSGSVSASRPKKHYWSWELHDRTSSCTSSADLQQRLVKGLPEDCSVCARGLTMLSQIRLSNSVDPSDNRKTYGDFNNLRGFDMTQMEEMEMEYENGEFGHPHDTNSVEKLANIACNVLVNGRFNTKDRTDYL